MTKDTDTAGVNAGGSPLGRRILAVSILASGMAFVDITALGVALPALQADLAATATDLLWINSGFSLPLAALLLLGGRLGDVFGRKRVFVIGILLFAVASLACGLSPGTRTLIAARVAQGLGAALMIPGSLAMISMVYGAGERGRAIGTWSAFCVAATAIGPLIGGVLAQAGLWRGVFFINLPVAGITLTLLAWKIPRMDHPRKPARLDYWGALFTTLGLMGMCGGLMAIPSRGALDPLPLAALGGGLLAWVLFGVSQRRSEFPLIPPVLYRSRLLISAAGITLLVYTAFYAMLFLLPLNLIQVQGYNATLAGAAMLPLMVLLIVFAKPAGQWVDRHGPRAPLTLGPITAGIGFLLLSGPGITDGPQAFWTTFFPGLLVMGAGLGMTAAPLSATVMGSVDPSEHGLASGINSTLSRLSALLGIAVLGSLAVIGFKHSLSDHIVPLQLSAEIRAALDTESDRLADAQAPPGLSEETSEAIRTAIRLAFIDAFRIVAWIGAGMNLTGALLAAVWIGRPPKNPG